MERRVTPPRRVTSPTWGPPPPCKQALKQGDRDDLNNSRPISVISVVAKVLKRIVSLTRKSVIQYAVPTRGTENGSLGMLRS